MGEDEESCASILLRLPEDRPVDDPPKRCSELMDEFEGDVDTSRSPSESDCISTGG